MQRRIKNCGKRNSREDRGEGGERKRSVARSRQDKSWGDEEANIFFKLEREKIEWERALKF